MALKQQTNKYFLLNIVMILITGYLSYDKANSILVLNEESAKLNQSSETISNNTINSMRALAKNSDSFLLLKNDYANIKNSQRNFNGYILKINRTPILSNPVSDQLKMTREIDSVIDRLLENIKDIEANRALIMSIDKSSDLFYQGYEHLKSVLNEVLLTATLDNNVRTQLKGLYDQLKVENFSRANSEKELQQFFDIISSIDDRASLIFSKFNNFESRTRIIDTYGNFSKQAKDYMEVAKLNVKIDDLAKQYAKNYEKYVELKGNLLQNIDEQKSSSSNAFILYLILLAISIISICVLSALGRTTDDRGRSKEKRYKQEISKLIAEVDRLVLDNKFNYSYRLSEGIGGKYIPELSKTIKKLNQLVQISERHYELLNSFNRYATLFDTDIRSKLQYLAKNKDVHKDAINIGLDVSNNIFKEMEVSYKHIEAIDNDISNITNEFTNNLNILDDISFSEVREKIQNVNKKIKKIGENIAPTNEKAQKLLFELTKIDSSLLNVILDKNNIDANGDTINLIKEIKNLIKNSFEILNKLNIDFNKLEYDIREITENTETVINNIVSIDKQVEKVVHNSNELKGNIVNVRTKVDKYSENIFDLTTRTGNNIKTYENAKIFTYALSDISDATKKFLKDIK
jgi:hypothetical protein